MKLLRKFVCIILCLVILLVLVSCSNESGGVSQDYNKTEKQGNLKGEGSQQDEQQSEKVPENFNPEGFPIVNEPITLRIFARKFVTHVDWNEMLVWQEYEKLTNIHVEWELVSDENLVERRNVVLASGDLPDAFHTALFSSSDVVKYAAEGLFMRVDDLIEKYAPNLKKLLEDPITRKGLTLEDGGIYSFPLLVAEDAIGIRAGGKLWYRTEWMKNLGLAEPTNTEEFYNFLKAIKEGDPNGNGKADEIPLSPYSIGNLVAMLKGAWGLGNRGSHHPWVDVDESTGELRFIPTHPRYKELLEYCHKLYKEGLIDEQAFTPDWSKHVAKGQEGLYGAFYGIGPILFNQVGNYEPASIIEGPHGDKMWHPVTSTIWGIGNFVITTSNKYPEATVRWIDYFYGDEGCRLFFMGKEGVTYYVTPEGEYEFLDIIKNNPEGLNLDQAVGRFTSQPGGGYPGLLTHKYFKGAEGRPESIEGSKKLEPYFPKEIWPPNLYNAEQVEIMSTIGNDIGTYINESMAKFIRGDMSFSEWDNYVEQFNKMELDEYMEVYKDAAAKLMAQ